MQFSAPAFVPGLRPDDAALSGGFDYIFSFVRLKWRRADKRVTVKRVFKITTTVASWTEMEIASSMAARWAIFESKQDQAKDRWCGRPRDGGHTFVRLQEVTVQIPTRHDSRYRARHDSQVHL